MTARTSVLQMLSEKVGFEFNETQLSPSLRKSIGQVEALWQEFESSGSNLQKQYGSKTNYEILLLALVGVGIIAILWTVFSIAVITLVIPVSIFAYLVYLQRQKIATRIQKLQSEDDKLFSAIKEKIGALSTDVFSELSAVHQASSRTSQPSSTTQIVRETVLKEVVMIPCSYCRGLMPQTSVFCPNCGAHRRG